MATARRRSPAPQEIPLADGRVVRIRPVSASDEAGLAALFDELDDIDLYRRFFQVHPPPARVIADMTAPWRRGGIGLVAELVDSDGRPRIVGEAAYAPLDGGDGELAITVARAARGWLGPYLLDVLLQTAAEHGVANLQADVLCENGPMLALLRARGYATLEHSEQPAIVRLAVSTTGRVPGWSSDHERPRLLVEVPGARWHGEAAARAAGFEVRCCPGPAGRWARCPALAGRRCPLAAGADVIVDAIDPSTELGEGLLGAHEALHDAPVHVERPPRRRHGSGRRPPPAREDGEVALLRHLDTLARSRRPARTTVRRPR